MRTTFWILLILGISFSTIGFIQSFAQQAQASSDPIFISEQIILRNSDGQLVSFLEIHKFGYVNMPALNEFLDKEAASGNDPVFTVNGQNLQLIRRSQVFSFDSANVVSDLTLNTNNNGKVISLIRPIHDGLPGNVGDKITTVWTFVRPV